LSVGRKITVCISGFAATGKSTVARKLARSLGLRYVSGGDALKALAVEMGYRPGGREWWEMREGLEFLSERRRNLSFDRMVDEKLLEMCREGGVVVDSWVLPWLVKDGESFNVWLGASERARAERMARRSSLTVKQALRILRKRDRESSAIYQRLYGIRLGQDVSPFHLIVDTTHLTSEQVFRAVRGAVKRFFGPA